MPCIPFTVPGGGRGFACMAATRCKCGRRATRLCDWKAPERPTGTCDRAMCVRCTTRPAPEKDLCPTHAESWRAWLAKKEARLC